MERYALLWREHAVNGRAHEPGRGHDRIHGCEQVCGKVFLHRGQARVRRGVRPAAHGTQPGGWTRQEGAGRVAVLTPGHNVEVWLHPSYQTLIGNALRWCARQE